MSGQSLELGSSEAPRDPEELEAQATTMTAQLSLLTRLGPVHLTFSDLEQSLSYYRTAVRLEPVEESRGRLSLGHAGHTLLVLVEKPGARAAHDYTGVYHFALLVPERTDLARWRTPPATACRCGGSPTTTSARRSTFPTRTVTGSRSTGTVPVSTGRGLARRPGAGATALDELAL